VQPFGEAADIVLNSERKQFKYRATTFLDGLKSFTLFSKLQRNQNLRVISSNHYTRLLGDLSCSYHRSQVKKALARHMIKDFIQFSSWRNSFSTNQTCGRTKQIS
jgi:hypothetical protein